MRLEGKLVDWNDAKGFGFVQAGTDRERFFAHINDFEAGQSRPASGDSVSFARAQDKQGRPRAVQLRVLPENQALPGASLWAGTAMATSDRGTAGERVKTLGDTGRVSGHIVEWNDERGFGFVSPDAGGERVFLHIKAMGDGGQRPARGDRVSCRVVRDDKGSLRAEEARLALSLKGRVRRLSPAVLFTGLFLLTLSGFTVAGWLPRWLLVLYVLSSLATFAAYAIDKSAARNNRWRTQESTLHLLALACGWPGALAAQRLLRHKSVKREFQTVYWATVLLNCLACVALLSEQGQALWR